MATYAVKKWVYSLTIFVTTATVAWGQQPIRYLEAKKLFVLDIGKVSYVFGLNQHNELQHHYWGGRLWRDEDLPATLVSDAPGLDRQEYPGWGESLFSEPSLKVSFPDGNRAVVLHYVSHAIAGDTLTITLKDILSPLYAHLHYKIFPETGILRRDVTIENRTDTPVVIESAQSAAWSLPRGPGYRLRYLSGRWAGEWQLHEEPVQTGTQVLESRRGITSHQMNPWFALDRDDNRDQEKGDVWFGALGWSGNWKISVEQTPDLQVRVTGGYNTFDFAYRLPAKQSLTTPPFYAGYTEGGMGEASRILHRFERTEILPKPGADKVRPVLYNSWEATQFNVEETGQEALADKAASIGAERFVMDDGWFGKRNNDHTGLGDWYVNPAKFPHGLKPLIDHVHRLGMDFGLWVEPEMVNPDSDLYRQHPDWAMHYEGRPRTESRNQLVLNMARDDVKEYTYQWLDQLVKNNDIAFLKWDNNRYFTEPGWPEVPAENQRMLWVKYTQNVYEILDRLRARYPKLEIETCASGGGRVDLSILRRVDQAWTSDNTEALDRLTIQDGFSYAYTPHVMMDWVTDVPNFNGRSVPLKFRFLVAMQGSLGIGADLNKWQDQDLTLAKEMIAYYKQVRNAVQNGLLYRLASPRQADWSATEYVAEDGSQAVVYSFLHSQHFGRSLPLVRLLGLEERGLYRIHRIDAKVADKSEVVSGAYLMHEGVGLSLEGDYDSTSFFLERIQR